MAGDRGQVTERWEGGREMRRRTEVAVVEELVHGVRQGRGRGRFRGRRGRELGDPGLGVGHGRRRIQRILAADARQRGGLGARRLCECDVHAGLNAALLEVKGAPHLTNYLRCGLTWRRLVLVLQQSGGFHVGFLLPLLLQGRQLHG